MSKNSSGKFVVGAMIGAVIGAIGGLLYAPKKGTETRRELKGKLDEYKGKAETVLQEIQEKGINLGQEVQKVEPKQPQDLNRKRRFFKGI